MGWMGVDPGFGPLKEGFWDPVFLGEEEKRRGVCRNEVSVSLYGFQFCDADIQ